MKVSHPKALAYSLGVGVAIAVVGGTIFAVVGDREWLYATGTVGLIVGLIAFAMGLLGAAEPDDGWATGVGRHRRQEGRRSLAAQVSRDAPGVQESNTWHLAAWGIIVGGGLIGLSAIALSLS